MSFYASRAKLCRRACIVALWASLWGMICTNALRARIPATTINDWSKAQIGIIIHFIFWHARYTVTWYIRQWWYWKIHWVSFPFILFQSIAQDCAILQLLTTNFNRLCRFCRGLQILQILSDFELTNFIRLCRFCRGLQILQILSDYRFCLTL